MAELQIWNNPCLALEYSLSIDLDTGKAFYHTNFSDGRKRDYECFFLVGAEACQTIAHALLLLSEWQDYCGSPERIRLDGYRWRIKITDGTIRIFQGDNSKPPTFDDFIATVEKMIHKTLGGGKDDLPS